MYKPMDSYLVPRLSLLSYINYSVKLKVYLQAQDLGLRTC